MPGPEPGADFGPQAAGAAKKPGLGDVLRQGYNYAKGELGRIGQKSGVGASELAAHSPEPLAPAQPAAEAEWDPFADDPNAPPRPETPDQAREARISSVLAEIVDAPRQQAAAAEIPDDELPDWLSSSEIGQGSEPSASPVVAGPTRPAPDEVAFGVGMINRHNVRRADNPAGPGAAVPAASLSESPAAAGAGDDAEPAIKAYNTEDLDIPAFLRRRNAAAAPAVASETAVDASSPQTRRADDFAEHATKGGPAALVQGQGARPGWLTPRVGQGDSALEISTAPPPLSEAAPPEAPTVVAPAPRRFSFQKSDAPAPASVTAPPEAPTVVAPAPRRFSFQKSDAPASLVDAAPPPADATSVPIAADGSPDDHPLAAVPPVDDQIKARLRQFASREKPASSPVADTSKKPDIDIAAMLAAANPSPAVEPLPPADAAPIAVKPDVTDNLKIWFAGRRADKVTAPAATGVPTAVDADTSPAAAKAEPVPVDVNSLAAKLYEGGTKEDVLKGLSPEDAAKVEKAHGIMVNAETAPAVEPTEPAPVDEFTARKDKLLYPEEPITLATYGKTSEGRDLAISPIIALVGVDASGTATPESVIADTTRLVTREIDQVRQDFTVIESGKAVIEKVKARLADHLKKTQEIFKEGIRQASQSQISAIETHHQELLSKLQERKDELKRLLAKSKGNFGETQRQNLNRRISVLRRDIPTMNADERAEAKKLELMRKAKESRDKEDIGLTLDSDAYRTLVARAKQIVESVSARKLSMSDQVLRAYEDQTFDKTISEGETAIDQLGKWQRLATEPDRNVFMTELDTAITSGDDAKIKELLGSLPDPDSSNGMQTTVGVMFHKIVNGAVVFAPDARGQLTPVRKQGLVEQTDYYNFRASIEGKLKVKKGTKKAKSAKVPVPNQQPPTTPAESIIGTPPQSVPPQPAPQPAQPAEAVAGSEKV